MRTRADTANFGHNSRQFLNGPSLTEFFESSQFNNLEIGVLHISIVIEKYIDFPVPFESGHW